MPNLINISDQDLDNYYKIQSKIKERDSEQESLKNINERPNLSLKIQ